MLVLLCSQDVLVEDLRMLNSPSFHLLLTNVARAEVRRVYIRADRDTIRALKRVRRRDAPP